jgi:hypothetical protein
MSVTIIYDIKAQSFEIPENIHDVNCQIRKSKLSLLLNDLNRLKSKIFNRQSPFLPVCFFSFLLSPLLAFFFMYGFFVMVGLFLITIHLAMTVNPIPKHFIEDTQVVCRLHLSHQINRRAEDPDNYKFNWSLDSTTMNITISSENGTIIDNIWGEYIYNWSLCRDSRNSCTLSDQEMGNKSAKTLKSYDFLENSKNVRNDQPQDQNGVTLSIPFDSEKPKSENYLKDDIKFYH